MATKVSTFQIQNLNPSLLNAEGAIVGDVLVARPTPGNGGLTLTWSPTSVLPRTALHGQALVYNFFTSQWVASSINVGGGSALPVGTQNDINKVLTWTGANWVIASPQGTVTSVGINNTDGTINVSTPNTITTNGVITIGLNNVALSKINQGGATPQQVLTWNGNTNSWSPSAVTASVGTIRAMVLFDGTSTNLAGGTGILLSKNISSIVDNGIGDYTINFTTPFPNTNYIYTFGLSKNLIGQYTSSVVELSGSRTASSLRIQTGFAYTNEIFNKWDTERINLVFMN